MPPPQAPKKRQKPLPEDVARDVIAHEEPAPGDKVRMTFRVVLHRSAAEAPLPLLRRRGTGV